MTITLHQCPAVLHVVYTHKCANIMEEFGNSLDARKLILLTCKCHVIFIFLIAQKVNLFSSLNVFNKQVVWKIG